MVRCRSRRRWAPLLKFAAGGKAIGKKDLGLVAMNYGSVYVAQIAFGSNDRHALRSIIEAEQYEGPSLVIAYSHCIAHGYDLQQGLRQQKLAVESGHWPLFHYDPRLVGEGAESDGAILKDPKVPLKEYMYNETRFKMLTTMDPERAEMLETQGARTRTDSLEAL